MISNTRFSHRFGQAAGNLGTATTAGAREDRPKAKFWLNVGLMQPENENYPFASFAGIPLDNLEPKRLTNNADYNRLINTQNAGLKQLLDTAANMAPGESRYIVIDETTGLGVELRRAGEEQVATDEMLAEVPVINFR